MSSVLVAVADGVMTITINTPEKLNAVTREAVSLIGEALARAEQEEEVRAVVLTGAGPAFCSGADIAGDAQGVGALGLDAINDVIRRMRALPKPVLAVVRGPAAGVGVSFALIADIVLASEEAYFLLAFSRIGLMPDGGSTAIVAAAVGRARAMDLALRAAKLPAREAHAAGLIAEVVPDAELDARGAQVAAALAAGPTRAFALTKAAINDATLGGLDDALAREEAGQGELLHSADFAEGLAGFAEKRAPRFTGR